MCYGSWVKCTNEFNTITHRFSETVQCWVGMLNWHAELALVHSEPNSNFVDCCVSL